MITAQTNIFRYLQQLIIKQNFQRYSTRPVVYKRIEQKRNFLPTSNYADFDPEFRVRRQSENIRDHLYRKLVFSLSLR